MQTEEENTSLLEKLFVSMLKDVLWAEQRGVEALEKMQEAATTDVLQDALEDHKFLTQKHVSRLEKVFSLLGKEPEPKQCDAVEGLIKEAEAMISETKEGTMTRDAALIIAMQKMEHYEIASYGSLVQVALTLGYNQVAGILDKTLVEEEETDSLLTEIAESEINPMADNEDAEEEEDEEMEEEDGEEEDETEEE
jgi:ferritin-like metal-binding protein YciE